MVSRKIYRANHCTGLLSLADSLHCRKEAQRLYQQVSLPT